MNALNEFLVVVRSGAMVALAIAVAGCSPEGEAAESSGAQSGTASAPAVETPPQDVLDLSQLGIDEGSRMTAVIAVVDFSDFGCVHCADFHLNDFNPLYDEFVAGGDVLWKYIPITLAGFPNADLAGVTGICVTDLGPARTFPDIRDRLFAAREEWLVATPSNAREMFTSFAAELGIEKDDFDACVDGESATARLQNNNEMARRIGVTGTPTFLVQGSPVVGAPPLEDFQRVLRQLVSEARAAADANTGAEPTPDA